MGINFIATAELLVSSLYENKRTIVFNNMTVNQILNV